MPRPWKKKEATTTRLSYSVAELFVEQTLEAWISLHQGSLYPEQTGTLIEPLQISWVLGEPHACPMSCTVDIIPTLIHFSKSIETGDML